ncbi:MAG: AAA family ATPase [Acidobacteriota bacterium]
MLWWVGAGLLLLLLGALVVMRHYHSPERRIIRLLRTSSDLGHSADIIKRETKRESIEQKGAIFRRLNRLLETHPTGIHPAQIEMARLSAALLPHVRADSEAGRRELIVAVEERLAWFEAGLAGERDDTDIDGFELVAWSIIARDRFFLGLFRAEGIAHLSALRGELCDLLDLVAEQPEQPFVSPFESFDSVLDVLEHIGRLPGAEDRALFLGRALANTVSIQQELERRYDSYPAIATAMATLAFARVRSLLVAALEDIHQRAQIEVRLHTESAVVQRRIGVVLGLRNAGQGHAHNIRVTLLPGEGYRPLAAWQEMPSLLRAQAARLDFHIEALARDRLRLLFHIEWDDLERAGQSRRFADVITLRAPVSREFRPLKPNPYVVGRPLLPGDVFIGRTDIFARIAASLEGVNQDNVMVLTGQRRMGKTSILRRLSTRLGDGYVCAMVDLQGVLGSGESAFLREMTAMVRDELATVGIEVDEPTAEDFDRDPGTAFRRGFLGAARTELGDRRLLLVFDEFEVLAERIRDGLLPPRVLPFFRSIMQHETGVSFVFAGTHRLDELTGPSWSALFDLAVQLDVGSFSRSEVEELLTGPTRGWFEFDPLAVERVFQLTGGHPHFSQMVARELVEVCNDERIVYVTVQDIETMALRVVDKGQLHVARLWDEADDAERLFLLTLKELLDREGVCTLPGISQLLTARDRGGFDLEAVARRLLRRALLTETGGQLFFRMELMRLWLDFVHRGPSLSTSRSVA